MRKTRVVCLVRKSSLGYFESCEQWHEQLRPHAQGLFNIWLNQYHYTTDPLHSSAECHCQIENVQVTLAAISSNENLLTSQNYQIAELRAALWTSGEVVLCSLRYDGAFTNLKGYADLLQQLINENVNFSHLMWLDEKTHSLNNAPTLIRSLQAPVGVG